MSVIGSPSEMAEISPQQLYELHQSGKPVELIDVRLAEYRSLHVPMARLASLDELNPKHVMETRQGANDEPLYVICRSGTRGEKACGKFLSAGYSNVVNVTGGTLGLGKGGAPDGAGQGNTAA